MVLELSTLSPLEPGEDTVSPAGLEGREPQKERDDMV